jgi:hypothetical protein
VLPLFFADFVLLMCYIFYLHVRWVLPEIQEPSREYDHGTWCAGASLGNCINDTSAANAYNGIAYNAKITMFDVDISSTENCGTTACVRGWSTGMQHMLSTF